MPAACTRFGGIARARSSYPCYRVQDSHTNCEVGSKNFKYNMFKVNRFVGGSKEECKEFESLIRRNAKSFESNMSKAKMSHGDLERVLELRKRLSSAQYVRALRSTETTNSAFEEAVERSGGPSRSPYSGLLDRVDADGDGLISYGEYLFFVTLLAIPDEHFELAFRMFDSRCVFLSERAGIRL